MKHSSSSYNNYSPKKVRLSRLHVANVNATPGVQKEPASFLGSSCEPEIRLKADQADAQLLRQVASVLDPHPLGCRLASAHKPQVVTCRGRPDTDSDSW